MIALVAITTTLLWFSPANAIQSPASSLHVEYDSGTSCLEVSSVGGHHYAMACDGIVGDGDEDHEFCSPREIRWFRKAVARVHAALWLGPVEWECDLSRWRKWWRAR